MGLTTKQFEVFNFMGLVTRVPQTLKLSMTGGDSRKSHTALGRSEKDFQII